MNLNYNIINQTKKWFSNNIDKAIKNECIYTPLILKLLNSIQKGEKILDVGCGSGKNAKTIVEQYGHSMVGIDFCSKLIEYAIKNRKGSFWVMNAHDIIFEDESFGSVILSKVLEHIDRSDINWVISEVRRVVKKSGLIMIVARKKEGESELVEDGLRQNRFTLSELRDLYFSPSRLFIQYSREDTKNIYLICKKI